MTNSIDTFHNGIALIHSFVGAIIGYYLMLKYGPFDIFDDSLAAFDANIIISAMYFSISYFAISSSLLIYDCIVKKIDYAMIGHHIFALIPLIAVFNEMKYIKLIALFGCMELSSFFLIIREQMKLTRYFGLFYSINELIFIITFFMCRFTYLLGTYFTMLVNMDTESYAFMILFLGASGIYVLNIIWGNLIIRKIVGRYLKSVDQKK